MFKTTDNKSDQKITVDIIGLMAMLSCGRATAIQIGHDAGAVLKVGRRTLYHVPKVEQYMENLTKE